MFGRTSAACFTVALVLVGLAFASAALNEQRTESSELLDLLTIIFIVASIIFLSLCVIFGLIFVLVLTWGYFHPAPIAVTTEQAREGSALEEDGPQQLIRVTPNEGSSMKPIQGTTVWEMDAYLDVEAVDQSRPLRNCRIKWVELEHYDAWTDKNKDAMIERWSRDLFYQGQTYFVSWSGRPHTVEAVDVPRSERASIAKCINTRPEWTTTAGAVGHMFHGDQYHLTVEVTADNSLPLVKEYWLQMYQGHRPIIEEWDDSRTTWQ